MGWLDRHIAAGEHLDDALFRRAMVMGTVMASFVVEKFSFDRMMNLRKEEIGARWQRLHGLTSFEGTVSLA